MGGEKTSPNRFGSRVPAKVPITDINQYLMCQLCSGYLVDATAIIECQHTFCKSCILKYLDTNSYCPICDVQLNKAKPHLSLRADTTLQKLVYKMVPGLLVTEVRRRKDYVAKMPPAAEGTTTATGTVPVSVEPEEADDMCVLSMEDPVSLSLEYYKGPGPEDALASVKKQQQCTSGDKANDRRYLQCPAAVSVGLLKKFIRMKYGLSDDYRVDLLYNGDRDNNLENDLTLLDVAIMFKWKKTEPMCFHYRIFDRPVKSEPVRVGSKRMASSMMDEPPDDDEASGTSNSSMTSASPSKLPRLSEAPNNSGSTGNQGGSSGGSGSGGTKKSNTTTAASDVVPMEITSVTPSAGKKSDGKSSARCRSHSKDDEKVREPSPPQTRSSITLKLSKRLAKVRRSRSNSSTTPGPTVSSSHHASITSQRNASAEGSVREAVEKIVLSKKQPERKNSDNSVSTSSSSSSSPTSSGDSQSPPSLKISLKNANLGHHHHHHHKHKHKSKDKEKHKHRKSGSSSPKRHHHKEKKSSRESKESSDEEWENTTCIKRKESSSNKATGSTPTNVKSSQIQQVTTPSAEKLTEMTTKEKESKNSSATTTTKKPPETVKNVVNQEEKANSQGVSGNSSNTHHQPHPLVPESVQMQVPKSVTLIPVNPNAPSVKRSASTEKNTTTVNRNTFTHPITNKSLHQITVTEVPPPTKSSSTGVSAAPPVSSSGSTNTLSSSTSSQSAKHNFEPSSSSTASREKPFNAPDSMEITKIYCDNSGKAFDAGKKLKERKGLDITISPSPGPQPNKARKLDDSLTFTAKFPPKGITTKAGNQTSNSTAATLGLPKNLNLNCSKLPGLRTNLLGNKQPQPESATKSRKSSITIEPSSKALIGIEKNSMSSAHRKAIGNLDSSIAIYEVGSLHRTPSPPKEKGLVVTPIPNKDAMMPPKVLQNNKRLEHVNKQMQQQQQQKQSQQQQHQISRQNREDTKERAGAGEKKREKSEHHDSPLDLSGKSSRSPTDKQSTERFPSPKPPTPAASPGASASSSPTERQKSKQQSSAAQTQTILSIAQTLAQKQQMQLQQQQHQQQQKQRSSPLPPNPPKSSHNQPHSGAMGSLTNSLSSPMIPMPTPSPPGAFHPLRNLVTLSDAASCLRKLQNSQLNSSLNQLVAAAAAGLCAPQPQQSSVTPSSLSPPATQMLPPARSSLLPHSMTMRPGPLPPTLGSPSSGTLNLPPKPNLLSPDGALPGMPWTAGLNPLRSMMPPPPPQALASGMNPLAHPFLSGLAHPPVSVAPVRPSPSVKVPNVNSKMGKDGSPVTSKGSSSSSVNQWSPMGMFSSSSSLNKSLPDNNKSLISNPHSSSASHILRSSSLLSSSASSSRQTKMNGTLGSLSSSVAASLVHSSSSPAISVSATTTVVAPSAAKTVSKASSLSSKNAIPNSMKISNFLPPPQSKSNGSSNAPATITSSSTLAKYFSSMPPLLSPQSPPGNTATGGNNGADRNNKSNLPLGMSSLQPPLFPLSSAHYSSAAANVSNFTKFRSSSPPPGSSARTLPVSKATAAAASAAATSPSAPESSSFALSINCDGGKASNSCSGTSSKSPTKSPSSSAGAGGTSSRASQPLNQAVRHIPNPSLLLNRQQQQQSNNNNSSNSCQTQNNGPVNNQDAAAVAAPVTTVPKVSPTTPNNTTKDSSVNMPPVSTKESASPEEVKEKKKSNTESLPPAIVAQEGTTTEKTKTCEAKSERIEDNAGSQVTEEGKLTEQDHEQKPKAEEAVPAPVPVKEQESAKVEEEVAATAPRATEVTVSSESSETLKQGADAEPSEIVKSITVEPSQVAKSTPLKPAEIANPAKETFEIAKPIPAEPLEAAKPIPEEPKAAESEQNVTADAEKIEDAMTEVQPPAPELETSKAGPDVEVENMKETEEPLKDSELDSMQVPEGTSEPAATTEVMEIETAKEEMVSEKSAVVEASHAAESTQNKEPVSSEDKEAEPEVMEVENVGIMEKSGNDDASEGKPEEQTVAVEESMETEESCTAPAEELVRNVEPAQKEELVRDAAETEELVRTVAEAETEELLRTTAAVETEQHTTPQAVEEELPKSENTEIMEDPVVTKEQVKEPENSTNDPLVVPPTAEPVKVELEKAAVIEVAVAETEKTSDLVSVEEVAQEPLLLATAVKDSYSATTTVADAAATNEISSATATDPAPNETEIEVEMTESAIGSPPTDELSELNQVECPSDDNASATTVITDRDELAIEDKLNEIKDSTTSNHIITQGQEEEEEDDQLLLALPDVKDFDENSDELIIDTNNTTENDEPETPACSEETPASPTEEQKPSEPAEGVEEHEEKQIELSLDSQEGAETTEASKNEEETEEREEREEEETMPEIAGAIEGAGDEEGKEEESKMSLASREISHPEPMEIDDASVETVVQPESSSSSLASLPVSSEEPETCTEAVREDSTSETISAAETIQTGEGDTEIDSGDNNNSVPSPAAIPAQLEAEVPTENLEKITQDATEDPFQSLIKREVKEEQHIAEDEPMDMDALLENFNAIQDGDSIPMDTESTAQAEEQPTVSVETEGATGDLGRAEPAGNDEERKEESNGIDEVTVACSGKENDDGEVGSPVRPDSPSSIKVDLKKMEKLEKVAAGLLATAANSINNNNNNSFTSGVGVPCDLGVGTATTTA